MRDRTVASRKPNVRRKLVVGAADDRFEREADRVAKQVVTEMASGARGDAPHGPVARESLDDEELALKRIRRTPNVSSDVSNRARRVAMGADGGEVDHGTESEINAVRSGGRPLDVGLRRSVEQAFGADFSNVRMHTGGRVDRLNADLGARAFTTGSDVFVRSSDYRPDSADGRELIAHELTHVVQQGGARPLKSP